MKKLILFLFLLTTIHFAISVQAQVAPEQARNYQINETHTDQAGNTEAQKSLTVRVDSEAPTTQITTGGTGANGWYRGPVQVGLTATDPEVGVNVTLYRVDGGPAIVYGGTPFTVSGEGQHTVLYWSNDKLNHTEAQK